MVAKVYTRDEQQASLVSTLMGVGSGEMGTGVGTGLKGVLLVFVSITTEYPILTGVATLRPSYMAGWPEGVYMTSLGHVT